jgi:hypothetical protein
MSEKGVPNGYAPLDMYGRLPSANLPTINFPVTSVSTRTGDITLTSSDVGLSNVTNDAQIKLADLDIDSTLASNSDTKVASQKAAKSYVDNKYKMFFNIRDYGAVSDGVTDDTTAVQAAIDAASTATGGIVLFPGGTTVVRSIMWKPFTSLQGTPGWGTILKLRDNTNDHLIKTPTGQNNYYGAIRDMVLEGNKANNTGPSSCIYLYGADRFVIERCRIRNAKTDGIMLDGTLSYMSIGVQLIDLYIHSCDNNGISGGGAADVMAVNVDVGLCHHGITLPNSCFFTNVNCWMNTGYGFYGYYAANGNFNNCRAESNAYHGWILWGCQDMQFTGIRSYKNNTIAGTNDGFYMSGDATKQTTRISFTGGQFGLTGDTQRYGINHSTAVVNGSTPVANYILVTGAIAMGNVTAGLNITCANQGLSNNFT